jgi:hypothetical protein
LSFHPLTGVRLLWCHHPHAKGIKDAATAKEKAERLAHRAQTALKMEQHKAEMLANHDEVVARLVL